MNFVAQASNIWERVKQVIKPVNHSGYDIATLLFFGTTETNVNQTKGYIANQPDGYLQEMKKLGQASTAPGSAALVSNPYPIRLRPVSDLNIVYDRKVQLRSIYFTAYDVTLVGDANQDATTLSAIEGSLSSVNDAYVQARMRFSPLPDFQPNFFRPRVKVNGGEVVFRSLGNSYDFGTNDFSENAGDLSIGLPLPYITYPYADLGEVNSIEVEAQVCQIIEGVPKPYQRYAVLCVMEVAIQ